MKLIKSKHLQIVDGNNKILNEFPLITSIVFYNSNWFESYLRWKVQEDATYLKPLVNSLMAKESLSTADVESLQFYEALFVEIKSPQTTNEKEDYQSARKDLMSVGFRDDSPSAAPLLDKPEPKSKRKSK